MDPVKAERLRVLIELKGQFYINSALHPLFRLTVPMAHWEYALQVKEELGGSYSGVRYQTKGGSMGAVISIAGRNAIRLCDFLEQFPLQGPKKAVADVWVRAVEHVAELGKGTPDWLVVMEGLVEELAKAKHTVRRKGTHMGGRKGTYA